MTIFKDRLLLSDIKLIIIKKMASYMTFTDKFIYTVKHKAKLCD